MAFWTIVNLRERKQTTNFIFKFLREIIFLPFIWGSQKSKPGQFKYGIFIRKNLVSMS